MHNRLPGGVAFDSREKPKKKETKSIEKRIPGLLLVLSTVSAV